MRSAFVVAIAFCAGASASANTWENQYLANTGGSRLTQVPMEESHMTEAVVRRNDNLQLRVGCIQRVRQGKPSTKTYIAIGNGGPMAGQFMDITAAFDERAAVPLQTLRYAGGAYSRPVGPQLLAWLATSETVVLSDGLSEFEVEFPLDGAAEAIKEIKCLGEIP